MGGGGGGLAGRIVSRVTVGRSAGSHSAPVERFSLTRAVKARGDCREARGLSVTVTAVLEGGALAVLAAATDIVERGESDGL